MLSWRTSAFAKGDFAECEKDAKGDSEESGGDSSTQTSCSSLRVSGTDQYNRLNNADKRQLTGESGPV